MNATIRQRKCNTATGQSGSQDSYCLGGHSYL